MNYTKLALTGLLVGCITAFLQLQVQAQDVKAGKGIFKLELGLHELDVQKLLGKPPKTFYYNEEKANVKEKGVDESKLIAFVQGFGDVYQYKPAISVVYPVKKLYFEKHRLVHIYLTPGEHREIVQNRCTLKKKLNFGATEMQVTKAYGDPEGTRIIDEHTKEIQFLSQGISCEFTDGKLSGVHIFEPMKKKDIEVFTGTGS